MRKIYVPLRPSEVDGLIRLAHEQRRRPQDQAALWIAERLRAEQNAEPTQNESAQEAVPA
jgi:hypothetical protein